MLKEVVDFLLICSKFFYPDMLCVPDKLLKQCSVLWACADHDPSCVANCCGIPQQLATQDGS
jgi:hypothetical protein